MSEVSDRVQLVSSGYYNANLEWLEGQSRHTTWSFSEYQRQQHAPWSNFILELRATLYDLETAVYWLIYHSQTEPDHQNLYQILNFFDGMGGITWQSIVEAWIANDFEGRAATIATIDRMRQIVWNEPFYVAWAARPEDKWP